MMRAAAAVAALAWLAPVSAHALDVERFGLYVVAEDLPRSEAFYTALFGAPPRVRTPGLLGFDVGGAFYAVVSKAQYAPRSTKGSNVLPYIRVRNVDAEFKRAQALAREALESPTPVQEGPFRFFRLRDPDGNIIEIFSVGEAGKAAPAP